jgi:hypothetical protein
MKVRVTKEALMETDVKLVWTKTGMTILSPDFIELDAEPVEEKCNCEDLKWPHAHTGEHYPFKTPPKEYNLPERLSLKRTFNLTPKQARNMESLMDKINEIINYLK